MNRYSYDALNRVEATETVAGGTVVYAIGDVDDATGETATPGYEYDLVGNRITIDETSLQADDTVVTRDLEYAYDGRYQLTSEKWDSDGDDVPDAEYAYVYDLAGNRTRMDNGGGATTYTYNVRNEIAGWTRGAETCSYTYDANGNRKSKSLDGGVSVTEYVYDTSDRLVAVDTDYDGVGFEADFEAVYDYRTRRVSKTEDVDGAPETTIFRYDGGVSFQEWKDTDGDDIPDKSVEFVRGSGMGGGIGSILYSDRQVDDGQGGTVSEREYFVYSPAVGHVTATLTGDEPAAVAVESTDLYEAFGNVVKLDNGTWVKSDGPTSGASDNNRLANTKERDASIGLDNHGMRYYDPEIGRYTTRDPIGYADGPNVYLSVHNNPINFMDPLGLDDVILVDPGKISELLRLQKAAEAMNAKIDKLQRAAAQSTGNHFEYNGREVTKSEFIRLVGTRRVEIVPLFNYSVQQTGTNREGKPFEEATLTYAFTQSMILRTIRHELSSRSREDKVIYSTHGGAHDVNIESFGKVIGTTQGYHINVGGADDPSRMDIKKFGESIDIGGQPEPVFELQSCDVPWDVGRDFWEKPLRYGEFRFGESFSREFGVGLQSGEPPKTADDPLTASGSPSPRGTPGITTLPRLEEQALPLVSPED